MFSLFHLEKKERRFNICSISVLHRVCVCTHQGSNVFDQEVTLRLNYLATYLFICRLKCITAAKLA